MKTFTKLSLVIVASFLLMGGCQTTDLQSYATPANARIATALVCSNTLLFAVKDANRADVANYIYSVAHGIRTLAGGHVPNRQEVDEAVILFGGPSSSKWTMLGTNISGIYGGIFSKIKGDPKLALEYLEAIAAGCEDAASSYVTHATPSPSPVTVNPIMKDSELIENGVRLIAEGMRDAAKPYLVQTNPVDQAH